LHDTKASEEEWRIFQKKIEGYKREGRVSFTSVGYAGHFALTSARLRDRHGQRDIPQTTRYQNHHWQPKHTLEYLAAYSPDFNDIEPKWAQAKIIWKKKDVPLSSSLLPIRLEPFYIGSAIA
jgi:hypothetical protein